MTVSPWSETWGYTQTNPSPGGWIKPAGYWTPSFANGEAQALQPAPDNERSEYSRYNYNHSVMPYEVPVAALHGAPPYHFGITTSIPGATIEDWAPHYNPGLTCAGIVKLPPGTEGTYTVHYYDQEHTTTPFASVEVTVVLDDSKFVFVNNNGGSNTNPGTILEPIKDAAGWYKSRTDRTYNGKLLVFRGGLHQTATSDDFQDRMAIHVGKPACYMGYPGEAATIDFQNSWRGFESVNDPEKTAAFAVWVHDIYFANLKLQNFFEFYRTGDHGMNPVFWNLWFDDWSGTKYRYWYGQRDNMGGVTIHRAVQPAKFPLKDRLLMLNVRSTNCHAMTKEETDLGPTQTNNGCMSLTYEVNRSAFIGMYADEDLYGGSAVVFVKGLHARTHILGCSGWADGYYRGPFHPNSNGGNPLKDDWESFTWNPYYANDDTLRLVQYSRALNTSDASWHFELGRIEADNWGGHMRADRCTLVCGFREVNGEDLSVVSKSVCAWSRINEVAGYNQPEFTECTFDTFDTVSTRIDDEGKVLDELLRYKLGHEVTP